MKQRPMYMEIWRDLAAEKRMIFLAGPRQTGKTVLSNLISETFTNKLYFNWDIPRDRRRLHENPAFFETVTREDASAPLIVFDEIHKYSDWKNYLKGVYDQFCDEYQFLVSGSGRLDLYQRGGDSLAGRYYLFHLWPFTIAELAGRNLALEDFLDDPLAIDLKPEPGLREIWEQLAGLSGFPEPFLSGNPRTYRRWTNTYSRQLIREDIRDMAQVKSIGEIETLYYLLPSRIGSPLSVPSLSRDLKVSYNSVQAWLGLFERFFLSFNISPFTRRIGRAIQKERKVYLWDTPAISDTGARFENMVALELWRAVSNWTDLGHGRFSLHFIKNKEQQEVDFVIVDRGEKPIVLIEAKRTDRKPGKALKKFQTALNVPAVQLVEEGSGSQILSNGENRILVTPAHQWLSQLP